MQNLKNLLLTIILVLIVLIPVQSIAAQALGFDEFINYQVAGPLTFLLTGFGLFGLAGLGRKILNKQSQLNCETGKKNPSYTRPFSVLKEHRNLSAKQY